jgi:imidazole glycerol-phosphate synthase subunit HisF
MLKKRLIPKLLLRFKGEGKTPILVNSYKYLHYKTIGSPIHQAKIYEAQSADELVMLNMDSLSLQDNAFVLEYLKKFSENIFMPLTFGGGVKSLNCFQLLLNSGADKVSINTNAILNPNLITEAAKNFGSQCVVISIDFRKVDKNYEVFKNKGKERTGLELINWAKKVEDLGAGEIMLTDVDCDGTGLGLNIEVAKVISNLVKIPVIISGGCGLAEHFIDCFKKTKIEGVAAGNFFCNKDQNIFQTRSQILNNGILLRKVN